MSKLEELIQQYCPDGVEYKKIEDIFIQLNGMTGVTNKWAEEGNCQFIDYMNAYKNIKINVAALNWATVKNLNQTILKTGDVLFTSASETPDECAIASEIEDEITENVFLDDHLFGLRLKEEYSKIYAKGFLKYVFRSEYFRKVVKKVVRGVTRFYISKNDFMNLEVPLPALPVQREIVRILDEFSLLSAELAAELAARKKQYEYYRDNLLTFETDIKSYKLKDIVDINLGLTYTPTYVDNGVKFLSSKNIANDYLDLSNVKYISEEEYKKSTSNAKPKKGDILFTRVGSNLGHPVILDTSEDLCIFVSLGYLRVKNESVFNRYLMHWMKTNLFMDQVKSKTKVAPKANLNTTWLKEFVITLPPFEVQERIVNVLDKFDTICSDLNIGLPAEIKARQKQYEYYRDKILDFRRKRIMDYKNEWRFIKRELPKEISTFIDTIFEIYEIREEVHRENGIKFIIHTNEKNHTIPHVHTEYAEWSASIRIEDGEVFAGNLPRKQHKIAKKWILNNKEKLLTDWKNIAVDAFSVMTKSKLDWKD